MVVNEWKQASNSAMFCEVCIEHGLQVPPETVKAKSLACETLEASVPRLEPPSPLSGPDCSRFRGSR